MAPVTSLPALSERLRSLAAEAKDISDTVRDAADGSEHDPARLEEIRLRRQSLRDLMRKYGDSLSDVMAFGAEARERLNELLGYAERVSELEKAKSGALRHVKRKSEMLGGQWLQNSQWLFKRDCDNWLCPMQQFKWQSETLNPIHQESQWCSCLLQTRAVLRSR